MKKCGILLSIILISFISGCLVNSVKMGDTVGVDYIVKFENGTVYDTSYENVAQDSNIYIQNKLYGPLNFTAGKKEVIAGLDEGVIGMKVGDKKTLILPPEKAYGYRDPKKVESIPVIQEIPSTFALNRVIKFIRKDFNRIYGENHTVGDNIQLPKSTANFTIADITDEYVQLDNALKVGDTIRIKKWNATVIDVNETAVILKSIIKINETDYFFNGIWNSTVINISDTNITFKHNALPNMTIFSLDGWSEVSFNKTHITIDYNDPLADKTLIYEIELRSITHSVK